MYKVILNSLTEVYKKLELEDPCIILINKEDRLINIVFKVFSYDKQYYIYLIY